LTRYKELFGDCNVPSAWEEKPELGFWVTQQRMLGNRGKLSTDRKARLDALGFDWGTRHTLWDTMFTELKRYKEEFGHCNVPQKWRQNPKLGAWVSSQRAQERGGKLSSERKARLDALGFEWSRKN
jgi:Helicase associated domain